MNALALFLLLSFGRLEQYGPYPRPMFGGVHSVRAAHGNVLLAWSEDDARGQAHVHVVLLDSEARAASPIHVLPVLNPDRDAIVPAIGTDGESFLVVWEEALGTQQSVAMAIDRTGTPIGAPHAIYAPVPINSNDYAPARVHWFNGAYVVLTGTRRGVRVSADAIAIGPAAGIPEAVGSDGSFARADYILAASYSSGWIPWSPPVYTPTVRWWAGARSGVDVMPYPASMPYVVPAGDEFALTWATAGLIWYRTTNTTASLAAWAGDVDVFARPRMECAETRCVIAYATRTHDVEGLIIDHTNVSAPALHFIATATDRVEREPIVTMINNSRALVTWRSSGPDGEVLAGRIVHLPSKQRAVR